jgi:hypothetical protein
MRLHVETSDKLNLLVDRLELNIAGLPCFPNFLYRIWDQDIGRDLPRVSDMDVRP